MSNPLPLDSGRFRAPRETTPDPPLSALILSSSSHSPVVEPSSRQAASRLAGDSPNRGGAFPESPWQKLSGQNLGEILPEAILLEQQRERVQKMLGEKGLFSRLVSMVVTKFLNHCPKTITLVVIALVRQQHPDGVSSTDLPSNL